MPAATCFDVYGTLFDPAGVRSRLQEQLAVPAGRVDDIVALWRRKQLSYSYQLALMDAYRPFRSVTESALDYALDYHGVKRHAMDANAILTAYDSLDAYDTVKPTLNRLEDAGYRLAVLSNGDPAMLEAVLDNAGLLDRFEAVISADEVGTYKPAPAVYEQAAERLTLTLDDCLLVSANAWDVAGATQAGMSAAWVDRHDDPPERVGGESDYRVPTLAALPAELM